MAARGAMPGTGVFAAHGTSLDALRREHLAVQWHSLRCAAQAYEPFASTNGFRWVTQWRSSSSTHTAEWPAQTSFPHDPHAPTSSDAKIAASSCAQPARCCAQTRRRDVSVRRRCGEQCTCPSTAHTAYAPRRPTCRSSRIPSLRPHHALPGPASQVRRHAVQRRRRPFGASAWLCSACRLQTTGRSRRTAPGTWCRPHARPRRTRPRAPCSTATGTRGIRGRARHTPLPVHATLGEAVLRAEVLGAD